MSPTRSGSGRPRPVRRAGRLVPWLAGGVVAVVVLVAAVALYARVTADDPPLDVVEEYLAAYPDRDCEALMGLVTREWWTSAGRLTSDEALRQCRSTEGEARLDSAFQARRVLSEHADRAVVEIEVTHGDGQVVNDEVLLRRQGGTWRVDPLG